MTGVNNCEKCSHFPPLGRGGRLIMADRMGADAYFHRQTPFLSHDVHTWQARAYKMGQASDKRNSAKKKTSIHGKKPPQRSATKKQARGRL